MSYTEKAKQFIGNDNGDDELNSSIRNMAVGLTPTLLNFLGNRSAQMQMRGFQKADKFTQGIADEKGVEVIGGDGNPVIMPEGEAMFRQPYKKENNKNVQQERLLAGVNYRNLDTDEIRLGRVTSQGLVDAVTLEPFESGPWVQDKSPDIRGFKDVYGGYSLAKTDKLRPNQKTNVKQVSPGEGNIWGNIPKSDVDYARQQADKAKKDQIKVNENIIGVDTSIDILSNPEKINEVSAAAAYQNIAKALNKDRMTDDDYDRLIGRENRSYYRAIEDWASRKFTGTPSQQALHGMKMVAKAMRKDLEDQYNAIGEIRKPDFGKNKKAEKKYKSLSGDLMEKRQKSRSDESLNKIQSMIKALEGIK